MRCATTDDLRRELAHCVATPSPTPPGDAPEVAAWVAGWCAEFGADVERQPVESGGDNVIATLRFGPGARLVFNTHMDVVDPAGQAWRTPPFTAVEQGERTYGRGTCDAKGSLVAMLAALERLAGDGDGLRGEIVLTAVVAEEAGGFGSRRLVRDGFAADAAVVGEPTGLLVARAHKGTYMHRLRFAGRAAHSASPWLGHDAIADAAAFVAAAERETARLARRPHPALGPATMTVTTMSGGTFQNTVAADAVLTVDRRLVPGETHAGCDAERAALLAGLAQQRPGLDVSTETVVATVPSETAADAPIVRAALAAVAAAGHPAAQATGFNAGCDMSKLVGAGIPTVICGPGHLAQAHGPDEYVETQQVFDAVTIYEHIARTLLGSGAPAADADSPAREARTGR